jgi:3-oxoacyl-[acyl-carrier-protein] synthase III
LSEEAIMVHVELPKSRDGEQSPPKENGSGMGTGIYLPAKVLTNDEIGSWGVMLPSGRLLTSDAIAEKIGVKRRHIADKDESVADMGFKAASQALGDNRVVDFIVASTSHPTDYNLSAELGRRLGIEGASVMDVHAACSGSAMAFSYVHVHREELQGKKVLLVAAEKLSDTVVDLQKPDAMERDPSLGQTILGDGAAAITFTVGEDLLTHFAIDKKLPSSDGSEDLITMALGDNKFVEPFTGNPVACLPHSEEYPRGYFTQDGPRVFYGVQSAIPEIVRDSVRQAGFTPGEIDFVVAHPGSKRMVDALRRNLSEFKVHSEFAEGNMSSASMLYSLVDAIDKGLVGPGSRIVLSGFGAGSPHLFSSTVVVELG